MAEMIFQCIYTTPGRRASWRWMGGIWLGLLAMALVGGCAAPRSGAAGGEARPELGVQRHAVLWVDWAAMAQRITDAEQADAFCRAAREAGITALAMEAVTPEGTMVPASDTPAGRSWALLAVAAPRHRLLVGAVFSAMVAPRDAPPDRLVQRATWGEGNVIQQTTQLAGPESPRRWSLADAAAVDQDVARLGRLAGDRSLAFVLLEGVGHHDLQADFSPAGRASFESTAGLTMRRWPADVLGEAPPTYPLDPRQRGPYWNAWLTWRADLARQYLVRVKAATLTNVSGNPPRLMLLVDGPYAGHVREGLNWAHPLSEAVGDHRWLPEGYERTAAGHLVDGVAVSIWEPSLLSASLAEDRGFAWWASLEAISAGARRYTATGVRHWGAVPAGSDDTGWVAGTRAAWELNDGVLVIGAGALSKTPGGFESLKRAWR